MGPVSSGQHKINRQQHNSTQTLTSRYKLMFFMHLKWPWLLRFFAEIQNHRKS